MILFREVRSPFPDAACTSPFGNEKGDANPFTCLRRSYMTISPYYFLSPLPEDLEGLAQLSLDLRWYWSQPTRSGSESTPRSGPWPLIPDLSCKTSPRLTFRPWLQIQTSWEWWVSYEEMHTLDQYRLCIGDSDIRLFRIWKAEVKIWIRADDYSISRREFGRLQHLLFGL